MKEGARNRTKRCLLIASAYVKADPSPDDIKNSFYHDLDSIQKAKIFDVMTFAGDLNVHVHHVNTI